MMKRNGSAIIGGCVVAIVAGIASCSFPTYEITVTGGGATTTTTGSAGGAGGASAMASSGSSTITSTSSGMCLTDGDGDKYISAKCAGGNDCADGDPLANPKGDFHSFPIQNAPSSTLPYDFNCDGKQEYELTTVIDCTIIPCNTTTMGWLAAAPACGGSGQYGTCKVGMLSCNPAPQGMQQQKCR